MDIKIYRALGLIAVCMSFAVSGCAPQEEGVLLPSSRPALLALLENAEYSDHMNSTSWSISPSIDLIYDRKAQEVQKVIDRIKQGRSVPAEEIRHALDNSDAIRIGGY